MLLYPIEIDDYAEQLEVTACTKNWSTAYEKSGLKQHDIIADNHKIIQKCDIKNIKPPLPALALNTS